MKPLTRSSKLSGICYDIRGPVLEEAKRLEDEGQRILKLNIGNPAPFGFEAPDDILKDVIHKLPSAQGYSDSNGIYSARVAVQQYYQTCGFSQLSLDNIYIGNGVSELIMMSMQALLNTNDEILIPCPDYPLWTGCVKLSSGKPVHYLCDEEAGWLPDIADMKAKITSQTKAIVLINPNNPTGAVYPVDLLNEIIELARKYNLIIFSDEIYDKILYNGATHVPIASLCDDVLCVTFSGLSKNYRVAGFRVGWMVLTGPTGFAKDYIKGLDMLSSMRLCANVPMQHAIQTALGGFQSIYDLTKPEGRLHQQMEIAYRMISEIPGLSCVKPQGALYLFPKIDTNRFNIKDDEGFVLDFLKQHKVLLVHGRGFNWDKPDHFRLVFLPHRDDLERALQGLDHFMGSYIQKGG